MLKSTITSAFRTKENLLGFLMGVLIITFLYFLATTNREVPNVSTKSVAVGFDPPLFDFGTVLQGQTLHHEFTLFNRSDTAIRVVGVRTSCSCTVVSNNYLEQVIPPHATASVFIDYSTGAREGHVSSDATFFIESQKDKYKAKVIMMGNVNADFNVEPLFIDFGNIKPGEAISRTVTFRPNALPLLSLVHARSTRSEFEVLLQAPKATPSGESLLRQVIITFRAPTANRFEELSALVQVDTSSKRVPVAKILVRGGVVPDIEIAPDVIVLASNILAERSRFTIQTKEPSRIVRAAYKTSKDVHTDHTIDDNSYEKGDWGLIHISHIPNNALSDATQINFELEVRSEADKTEIRSVSAQIKGL